MERNRGDGREHGGDNERCEFQHGDHDVPPDLRFVESHTQDQFQSVDKQGLTGGEGLNLCGDKYTTCRAGLTTPQASVVSRTVNTHGEITNLELRYTSHSESNANIGLL